MRVFRIATILVGFAAAAACGADEEPDAQALCGEGESRACNCAGGLSGEQECSGGGFSACTCDGVGGSGGAGGMGGIGGGVGGAGGTAGEGGAGGSALPVCVQFAGQDAGLPHCEARLSENISAVCTLDGCADAGRRRSATDLERGAIKLYGFSDPVMMPISSIKSYLVQLYYPTTHLDEPLDCDAILAADRWFDPSWNLVSSGAGPVSSPGQQIGVYIPNLPVNDADRPFLAQLAFYGGPRGSDGKPTGQVISVTCLGGIVVPEGPFVEEQSRIYTSTMIKPPAAPAGG